MKQVYFDSLKKITAIDGRHCLITKVLNEYFSEHALFKYRLYVEVMHLIKMSEFGLVILNKEDKDFLLKLFLEFNIEDSKAICEYDHFGRKESGPFEHDVKSVEIYIKEKLEGTNLQRLIPMIHFGFTSADVNNLAYSCMISDTIEKVCLPIMIQFCDKIEELSLKNKSVLMLSRTHGQPASPTTFGKEMANFLKRFSMEIKDIKNIKLSGKMNGAVGNFNAHVVGFSQIDWLKYSKEFVESFGFIWEPISTQRGPKRNIVKLFQTIHRFNSILKDFNVDLWLYVSKDLLFEKKIESHVGSSVMPHKINPWLIECSEANIELANALFEVFARESEISRLQRDLSDHDHERNYGTAFGYTLIAISLTSNFLDRIVVNKDLMFNELQENKKVLSEAYQTILRSANVNEAYDIFKDFFRGKKVSMQEVSNLINNLDVNEEIKNKLKDIKVENYIGYAEKLVDIAIQYYKKVVTDAYSNSR